MSYQPEIYFQAEIAEKSGAFYLVGGRVLRESLASAICAPEGFEARSPTTLVEGQVAVLSRL